MTAANSVYPRLVSHAEVEYELDKALAGVRPVPLKPELCGVTSQLEDDDLTALAEYLDFLENRLRPSHGWLYACVDRAVALCEPLVLFLGMFVVLYEIFDGTLVQWRKGSAYRRDKGVD